MNFCGIICEFNPFHNGHEYLIQKAKEQIGGDIVCIMSGDFMQRGIPAIEDKYSRAQKAITAGADMVVELPTIYACSNAENFAFGAIKTLKALNVTHLAFGIENTNLEILQEIAELKLKNSQDFQNSFKNEIENGINYNTALKLTISKQFSENKKILEILNQPNNILAIEYLTAIKRFNAKIKPVAILRIDNGYESRKSLNQYLSATAIREKLYNGENIEKFVPSYAVLNNIFNKSCEKIYEKLIINKIRNLKASELEKFYDYSEGIEYRIKEMAEKFSSLSEIAQNVSTPRYRIPRINKLLLYPSLNITKSTCKTALKSKPVCKLLCIKKDKKYLLSKVFKTKLNLIITNNDYQLLNKNQQNIINIDLIASNLYNLIIGQENNKDKKIGVIFK